MGCVKSAVERHWVFSGASIELQSAVAEKKQDE